MHFKKMIKKNKKGFGLIGVLLIAIAVVGCTAGYLIYLNKRPVVAGSSDFTPVYPNPMQKVWVPAYGVINCKYTEALNPSSENIKFLKQDDHAYHWIQCPADAGSKGCEVYIQNFQCDYGGLCPGDTKALVSLNDGDYITYSQLPYHLNAGDNVKFKLACYTRPTCIFTKYQPPSSDASYYWYDYNRMLWLTDPTGHTQFGYLSGSGNCKLVSTSADTLKKMQKQTDNQIEGISQLGWNDQRHIVVKWTEESPAIINPLGHGYQNHDKIICKPYTGIYAIDEVKTAGGYTYYVQGSLLVSYTADNTICCGDNQCGGDYVCFDYHCVPESPCDYGECNPLFYDEHQECITEGNDFYLTKFTCGSDGCVQQLKQKVKCCRDYCEKVYGSDYYCIYGTGCVYIDYLKECPSGFCCIEGGAYKERDCPTGTECCIGSADGGNNNDVGHCKTECAPSPDEICYDRIDNDGDGVIDEQPCTIDCKITPDAEECINGDKKCKLFDFKCWWNKLLHKKDCKISWASVKYLGMDYIWCKFTNALGPFILILSGFGLIISWKLVYDSLGKPFKKKKEKWIRIVLGLIAGICVGYLIFTYWYIGLLLLILFILLKIILSKIKIR